MFGKEEYKGQRDEAWEKSQWVEAKIWVLKRSQGRTTAFVSTNENSGRLMTNFSSFQEGVANAHGTRSDKVQHGMSMC